ncbi:MAG: thermonuclease family protein [Alphaproteobacteria bacterium]|nr:thermonuclease family protein [Alphaproteobacteria bacterium]
MLSILIVFPIRLFRFLFFIYAFLFILSIPSDAQIPAIVDNVNNFDKYFYGKATITDGDSLKIFNRKVRLFGIDAPEMKQKCTNDISALYNCGKVAKNALINKISTEKVYCHYKDLDRYRRALSICWVKNINLNDWLVYNGYAVAYTRYSNKFIKSEMRARREKMGIWAGSFEMPEVWRRKKR